MCLYDLQKAFDSVEVPVLLQRRFDVGVCSKTWRILQSWYRDYCSVIHLGSQSSFIHFSVPGQPEPHKFIFHYKMLCLPSSSVRCGKFLCKESLSKLEKFQGEMAKGSLSYPSGSRIQLQRFALAGYQYTICTIRKLKYISRVISCDDQENVSRRTLSSLADNVEALNIVSECRELKERYCTDYTSSLLVAKREDGTSILKQMEECIKRKDVILLLESAQVYLILAISAPLSGGENYGTVCLTTEVR